MSEPFTVYLDESGTARWPPNGVIDGRRCHVAGILLTPAQQGRVADFVDSMLQSISDAVARPILELHFAQMMGRHGEFRGLPERVARHHADLFVDQLVDLGAPLVGRQVDLLLLRKNHGAEFTPLEYGLKSALTRTNQHARELGVTFHATFDGGENRHGKALQRFVTGLKTAQARLDEAGARPTPLLTHLLDGLHTPESQHSPGIQMADGLAWLLQRRDPRLARTRHLWLGGAPLLMPGARPLWSAADEAVLEAGRRRLQAEQDAHPLVKHDGGRSGSRDSAPSTVSPQPPPGARIKHDKFPWL